MKVSKNEHRGIITFLANMKCYRDDRKRLFKKAEEYPELVMLYIDSLSEKEKKDPLLQTLVKTAKKHL